MRGRALAWLSAVLLLWACGGNTVVDPGGSGGSGTGTATGTTPTGTTPTGSGTGTTPTGSGTGTTPTGSGTGTTPTGSGTGTTTCDYLFDQYQQALALAQACDTCDDGPEECGITAQYVFDYCGCPISVNHFAPDAVTAAAQAYQQWEAAGCGPYDCGQPCMVSDYPHCESSGPGCAGVCSF